MSSGMTIDLESGPSRNRTPTADPENQFPRRRRARGWRAHTRPDRGGPVHPYPHLRLRRGPDRRRRGGLLGGPAAPELPGPDEKLLAQAGRFPLQLLELDVGEPRRGGRDDQIGGFGKPGDGHIGFDPGTVRQTGDSVGLHSMAERADLSGGNLKIESSAEGTTIYVEVPV